MRGFAHEGGNLTTTTSSLDQPGGLTAYAVEIVCPDGRAEVIDGGIHSTLYGAMAHLARTQADLGDAFSEPITLRVVAVTITRKEDL